MSNELCLIRQQLLTDIANAIRSKTGKSGTIYPSDMDTEIQSIQIGITPAGSISITENGVHSVRDYILANVNVPIGITPTGSISISENGTYDVTNYASANVSVSGSGLGREYVVTYPINLSHQSVSVTTIVRDVNSNGTFTLKNRGVRVGLNPDMGYNAGEIIVDGVNSGNYYVDINPLSRDITVTATEATLKTYDNIILNTVLEPGLSSSSGQYYYEIGYYLQSSSSSDSYGNLTPNSFEYTYDYYGTSRTETITISLIYLEGSSGGGSSNVRFHFSLNNFYNPFYGAMIIGDPTTSNYWVFEGELTDYTTYDIDLTSMSTYFHDCYDNGTGIPIKIALL